MSGNEDLGAGSFESIWLYGEDFPQKMLPGKGSRFYNTLI
jgi:hypothetical protein